MHIPRGMQQSAAEHAWTQGSGFAAFPQGFTFSLVLVRPSAAVTNCNQTQSAEEKAHLGYGFHITVHDPGCQGRNSKKDPRGRN